jgi:hypothetical protein
MPFDAGDAAMFDAADWMTDPTVVSSFDSPVQDALDDTAGVSDLINDFLDSDLTAPADAPLPSVAPPLDYLPDPYLPDPFIPDLIHPDEFALNGFPYWGTDPTAPGYWSVPSL